MALIPGFTGLALRKFYCNLGLGPILFSQWDFAIWYLDTCVRSITLTLTGLGLYVGRLSDTIVGANVWDEPINIAFYIFFLAILICIGPVWPWQKLYWLDYWNWPWINNISLISFIAKAYHIKWHLWFCVNKCKVQTCCHSKRSLIYPPTVNSFYLSAVTSLFRSRHSKDQKRMLKCLRLISHLVHLCSWQSFDYLLVIYYCSSGYN